MACTKVKRDGRVTYWSLLEGEQPARVQAAGAPGPPLQPLQQGSAAGARSPRDSVMQGVPDHSGTNPLPSPPQTRHQGGLAPCPEAGCEGLVFPMKRNPEFRSAPPWPGSPDRGTPCSCHRCPSSPRARPSESGTALGPGPAAAAPGLGDSAPPAGPGRAPTPSLRLLACSRPRPSRIQRCCILSHSGHCGSDLGSTGRRLGCG